MDFRRKTKDFVEIKSELDSLESKYSHNVMLYSLPPTEDIKINEFEELALERLRVLRIMEQATSKKLRFLSDDWKEYVNAELSQEGLRGYIRLCTSSGSSSGKKELELHARRRDYISHFILRFAYCRSDDLQRWFIAREMELFRYKFSALSSSEIKRFLEINNLQYEPLNEEQKEAVKDGLYESTVGQSVAKIEITDFYKVPFTQVLDLVRLRRCYLKGGFAYVSTNDCISIVAVNQQNEIEQGLKSTLRLFGRVEADERLFYLVRSLHTSYTGKDYTISKNGSIPIESLDQLSKKSFPICMRDCHEHLRSNHHIKHDGRMQYGLFLKGIGITMEDSIRFWREEFCKKMDLEKFSKSYEYNIRHNYGNKGSMINYTPYSCLKIIQSTPTQGSCSGCPFKQNSTSTLKVKLTGYGLSASHTQEILNYVSKGHYQLACGKFFQASHDSPTEVTINHPNQYFETSQIVMGNRQEKKPKKNLGTLKKPIRRNDINDTTVFNDDDDDALWTIAESEEMIQKSQAIVEAEWEDDNDLTEINC